MKELVFRKDREGVSPIISAILLLVIMILTVGGIIAWALPRIQGMEYDAQYDGVYAGFEIFSTSVDDVIYGGSGTTRTVGIGVGGGDLILGSKDGYWLLFWTDIPENITISKIDSLTGEFKFSFTHLSAHGLSVNITGTGGNGSFISENGRVNAGFEFGELQHITISNATHTLAEAYYFRIRTLEFDLPTNHGYYEIKWLNGAIVTNRGSTTGSVSGTPYIHPMSNTIFVNIINLTANNSGILTGGKGKYDITVRNLNTECLYYGSVHSFSISIYSEYSTGWYLNLINRLGFSAVKDSNYHTIAAVYRAGESTELKLMKTDIEITGGAR